MAPLEHFRPFRGAGGLCIRSFVYNSTCRVATLAEPGCLPARKRTNERPVRPFTRRITLRRLLRIDSSPRE